MPKLGTTAKPLKKQNSKISVRSVSLEERLSFEAKNPLVQIRNMDVTFGYGPSAFKAVNDMSININRGEVLGLVGESGSGKSTTGNAIAGIVNHSAGSIQVEDFFVPSNKKAVKGEIKKKMVQNIQMIFQDPAESLNPFKSVEKVVSEGLENIDPTSLFFKTFDSRTIATLRTLLSHKDVEEEIKKINLNRFVELVDAQKFDQLKQELYADLISELAENKSKHAYEAFVYLSARSSEHSKLFGGKSSKRSMRKKMVIEVLKSVGLNEQILNRFPLEFSGGQQQRIGISRAIILNPKILIADEPISALDVSIQAQVINILNNLKESLGLTILFIAHDLRMVEYISDRIAVMYKGKLVEVGDAKEIASNPIHPYSKMLLDAVPSIDSDRRSLIGYVYDPRIHKYDEITKPIWNQIDDKNHFVFGTHEEISEWVQGNWAVVEEKHE